MTLDFQFKPKYNRPTLFDDILFSLFFILIFCLPDIFSVLFFMFLSYKKFKFNL